MKEFMSLVFGETSLAMYLACFLFAAIGAALFTATEVIGRDAASPATPKTFSWKFLALDNIKRYVVTVIVIFVQFRFTNELTVYTAFLMGFTSDGLAGMAKRYVDVLKADRAKLLTDQNNG